MESKKESTNNILIDLAKILRNKFKENIKNKDYTKTVANEVSNHLKSFAQHHGIQFDEEKKDQDLKDTNKAVKDIDSNSPEDWFKKLRFYTNKSVLDFTKSLKIENLGKILTFDLKKLFKLDDKDMSVVEASEKIGESIGEILDKGLKLPVFGPLFKRLASLITACNLKIVSNRKSIIETEFALQNIKDLMDFGVRHEQLTNIAETMFDRLSEIDKEINERINRNEALKKKVLQNIISAQKRVKKVINDNDNEMKAAMDVFDKNIDDAISNI